MRIEPVLNENELRKGGRTGLRFNPATVEVRESVETYPTVARPMTVEFSALLKKEVETRFNKFGEETKFTKLGLEIRFNKFGDETKLRRFGVDTKFSKFGVEIKGSKEEANSRGSTKLLM